MYMGSVLIFDAIYRDKDYVNDYRFSWRHPVN